MGFFMLLAGAIAAGVLIAYTIAMTYNWFKNKILQFFQNRNAKKAIAADLEKMASECSNTMSLDTFLNQGYTDVVASLDTNGNIIGDVEIIKDTTNDIEINKLYGNEGMIVIEG